MTQKTLPNAFTIMISLVILLFSSWSDFSHAYAAPQKKDIPDRLRPYIQTLKRQGKEPVQFVMEQFQQHDLILFDDAWHPAAEPFEFYCRLIGSPAFHKKVKYIFLEVVSINHQVHLDRYFNADTQDPRLLYPAFQDDFSGEGWPLKTYFDLMQAIYRVNRTLPAEDRLKVVAVNAPVYWPGIRTARDLELFRKSLIGNDYLMYKVILHSLDNFKSKRKGIFLTNTRHAYKAIKNKEGQYFWNCGTFFHVWHPGKTFSIRFHNMALMVYERKKPEAGTAVTTQGLERYRFAWVRMENGLWDSAFKALGNRPLGFSLKGNVFGSAPYVGNHVQAAAPGQTMLNANDGIIFLAPLENLHNTETVDWLYTPAFKKELVRRFRILYTPEQLEKKLAANKLSTLQQLIEKTCVSRPRVLIPQARNLLPMDQWQTEK